MSFLDAIRAAVLIMSCLNVMWTAPGTVQLVRWQIDIRTGTHGFIFLASASFAIFQIIYFWSGGSVNPSWTVTGRVFAIEVQFFAAIFGIWLGAQDRRYRGFLSVFEHPAEALAISDLARVDAASAARIADDCRRLTAEKVMAHG